MALYSMTGYGRSRQVTEIGTVDVEIRSINHRYVDLNVKVPRDFPAIEERLRALLTSKITRGRVSVNVSLDSGRETRPPLTIDSQAVEDYLRIFRELKSTYELPGEIDLKMLAAFPEIIGRSIPEPDADALWRGLEPVVDTALGECLESRRREGEAIGKAVTKSLDIVTSLLAEVEEIVPQRIEKLRERLKRAVFGLTEGTGIEESRLLYEVSLVAERWDVTEEIERLKSHLALLRSSLGEGGVLGRRLVFLCQEMHREANTISSKGNDSSIVHKVVLIKEEVEKIREQLENLE
jgi:uncharacterized protein (TIGR00255 family)